MDFTVNTVSEINAAAKNPEQFVKFAEKQYLKEVYSVAQRIADDDDIKIVALAGPSGSGKTTTAHILRDRLSIIWENTVVVSLDDFYYSNEKLPVLPDGRKDIESVAALDTELIKKCFTEVISSGKTKLPRFDFKNKKQILEDREIDVGEKGIIIAEGLHALNPLITDLVPRKNIFKAYISVNCSIGDSFGEQLLSSRQIRLARRVLRDMVFRATPVENTLSLWNGVVEGERKYLYCFKNSTDALIRTLHPYEPCIYRDDILRLKEEVTPDSPCYEYFMRTAAALEKFSSLPEDIVPNNSLIREFIGEGKYNQ